MRTLCWNWQLPWNGDFLKVPQVQQTSMLKNCTQCIVKSLWIFLSGCETVVIAIGTLETAREGERSRTTSASLEGKGGL